MKPFISLLLLAVFAFSLRAFSEDVSWALRPEAVYARLEREGEKMLFVDVRDPVEIMFVGFTDAVDVNIPFRLVDTSGLNPNETGFAMPLNPRFVEQIRAALHAKGLDENAPIVTMCRTGGARGRPSAEFLRANGFPNVWYVENGFQGEPMQRGPHQGHRIQNGWQNEGLPWRLGFDPEKIYTRPENENADEPAE